MEGFERIEPDGEIILRIYLAPSGQWSGKIFIDNIEIGGIAGYESAEAVEEAAHESGIYPDCIEVEPPSTLPNDSELSRDD